MQGRVSDISSVYWIARSLKNLELSSLMAYNQLIQSANQELTTFTKILIK